MAFHLGKVEFSLSKSEKFAFKAFLKFSKNFENENFLTEIFRIENFLKENFQKLHTSDTSSEVSEGQF